MRRSAGLRFFIVGILVLLMFVPLFFAGDIINSRKNYSESTIRSVGREWGGAQLLSGPQLVIPVEETVNKTSKRPKVDPLTGLVETDPETNETITESFLEEVVVSRSPVFIYPDQFDLVTTTTTEMRHRGIFTVPVYQANSVAKFEFPISEAEKLLKDKEVLLWEKATLRFYLSANRALRGSADLKAGKQTFQLEPLVETDGIYALLGDPRNYETFTLSIGFNGAQSLQFTPVGRNSTINLTSDWQHPSFSGAFLPDTSDIGEDGFTAKWIIPHLARTLPQVSRENPDQTARQQSSFGLDFHQPNNFYQKAYRAARYGILFIALTFLTVLLVENNKNRPTHPVQYILIGSAQSIFVVLMVAYAEQIGFASAYLLSSAATIALLTMFGAFSLKLGKRTWVLLAMLISVYAVLYMILQSADYALLAGATLAFAAIAMTMYATRNEEWYSTDQPKEGGLLSRTKSAMASSVEKAEKTQTPDRSD